MRRVAAVTCVMLSTTPMIAQVQSPDAPPSQNRIVDEVICGTRVRRFSDDVDARIVRMRPRGSFALRIAEPTVCRGSRATTNEMLMRRLLPQLNPPTR